MYIFLLYAFYIVMLYLFFYNFIIFNLFNVLKIFPYLCIEINSFFLVGKKIFFFIFLSLLFEIIVGSQEITTTNKERKKEINQCKEVHEPFVQPSLVATQYITIVQHRKQNTDIGTTLREYLHFNSFTHTHLQVCIYYSSM